MTETLDTATAKIKLIRVKAEEFIKKLSDEEKVSPYTSMMIGMVASSLLAEMLRSKNAPMDIVKSAAENFAAAIYTDIISTCKKAEKANEDSGNTFSDFPSDDVRPH